MRAISKRLPRKVIGSIGVGDHLRFEMRRLGLSQVALSEAISVSRQTINNIVRGRQSVSKKMAQKLAEPMGRTTDYWLGNEYPAPQEEPEPIIKLAKSSEVGKSKRRRRPWEWRSEKSKPFRAFILKLRSLDAGGRKLVDEIKEDREFPPVITWADLRFHLNRLGASQEYLVAARALWRRYEKLAK